jgi:hypothetical protein
MGTLRFSLPNVYEGLADAQGITRFEGDTLTLEFQIKDGLVGAIRPGPKRVVLPLTDLESISYSSGWFRSTVVIQTRTLEASAEIPGSDVGMITLCVTRKNRAAAQEFASTVNLRISGRKVDQMREELDL